MESWLVCYEERPAARLRLFCFPCAGGGAAGFHPWVKKLPQDIEIIGVRMPGTESRILERPPESIPEAVNNITLVIYPELDKPFAFFGHSVGALFGFELAREVVRKNGMRPVHFFAAGIRAPQVPLRHPPIHDLAEEEFLEEMERRYSGVPQEIVQDPDLLQIVLPGLRAGLKMSEGYKYTEGEPLDCDITVFGGYEDKSVNNADLKSWREQTKGRFAMHFFPGDHFFIYYEQDHLLSLLSSELTRILSQLGDGN
jgi:surfactin synthase thioesterase subunit